MFRKAYSVIMEKKNDRFTTRHRVNMLFINYIVMTYKIHD